MKLITIPGVYILFFSFLVGCPLKSFSQTGSFYGLTNSGGDSSYGVIFQYVNTTGVLSVVHSFAGITDGAHPTDGLLKATNGTLYGVTLKGGIADSGMLFSYYPPSNQYDTLMSFGGVNGSMPYGGLMQASNGLLYGTTYYGGLYNKGVIYRLDPSTNTYSVLYDFDGTSGQNPEATLLQASNGLLYGTTLLGGVNGNGVLFKYSLIANTITRVKDMDSITGRSPEGHHLIQGTDGLLYGTSEQNGVLGNGVMYTYNTSSGVFTEAVTFNGTNGQSPRGRLYQAANGLIYGSVAMGGSGADGNIFSYDPVSTNLTVLNNFTGANGQTPLSGMSLAADGLLYGTTMTGGTLNQGSIYTINPTDGSFNMVYSFDSISGDKPQYGAMVYYDNSATASKEIKKSTGNVLIYPVPSRDGFITVALNDAGYELMSIYDMQGREVYSQKLDVTVLNSSLHLSLAAQSSGLYLVRIMTKTGIIERKLLLQK